MSESQEPNERKLRSVVESHLTDAGLLGQFRRFHSSVQQKLWSVDALCIEIAGLKAVPVDWTLSSGSSSFKDETTAFGHRANMWLDCFLMNARASLDSLAHEIGVLYTFQPTLPDRIYIYTVKERLLSDHSSGALASYLATEMENSWFRLFASYRNCTTHESLVGDHIRLVASLTEGDFKEPIVLLPDDPTTITWTYREERELKTYCRDTTCNIVALIDRCYCQMATDLQAADNTLPIPPSDA